MPKYDDLTEEQRANLGRAANQILGNTETAREFKRLWSKANPQVKFPELEQEERIHGELKTRDDKIAGLEEKLLLQEAERRREEKRQAAVARGLDPDAVEALMIERGKIGRTIDYESAMELMELQREAAAATPAADGWSKPNEAANKTIKDMLTSADPSAIARQLAHEAIDELRGRRRRA